jgi:uncharacterized protein YacL (UPF0231 family)
VKLEFCRDDQGFPRVKAEEADNLLARFLEADVQGSVSSALDYLGTLDRVESGEIHHWEGTGNAHTLTLTPDGALIEAEWELEPRELQLSHAELREALNGWIVLLLDR